MSLLKPDLCGGVVASWLVRSSLDCAVQVRALAGDIMLCSWAGHFTLTVALFTLECKWVPANCWGELQLFRPKYVLPQVFLGSYGK